jgi:hypothetical protein
MVRYMLEVLLPCSGFGLHRESIRRRMQCEAIAVVQERPLFVSDWYMRSRKTYQAHLRVT